MAASALILINYSVEGFKQTWSESLPNGDYEYDGVIYMYTMGPMVGWVGKSELG